MVRKDLMVQEDLMVQKDPAVLYGQKPFRAIRPKGLCSPQRPLVPKGLTPKKVCAPYGQKPKGRENTKKEL